MKMEKSVFIAKRAAFFEDIKRNVQRAPNEVDLSLEQDKYLVVPSSIISDEENGELIIKVEGRFFNEKFSVMYSIWQVGIKLKIGINLKLEEMIEAFFKEEDGTVSRIWGEGNNPIIEAIHGGIFFDWEFDAKNLYDSYQTEEIFISGIRNMHVQTMKIIYNYLKNKKGSILSNN